MTDIHVIEAKPIVKPFYVYVHKYASGPKEGHVFYVGKGKGNRYLSKHSRSSFWNNIASKYGFIAEVLFKFNNESCAFSFEVAIIKFIGRKNLCNLTDGGIGLVGPCYLTKEKISKSSKGKKISDHHKEIISKFHTGKKMSKCAIEKTRQAKIGKKMSLSAKMNMSIAKSGKNHPNFDSTVYEFRNKNGTVEFSQRYDFIIKNSLHVSSVCKLLSGMLKTHKGWSVVI